MKVRCLPSLVYRDGEEPDLRFPLAHGRTFLFWIRTSLAWIAAGVALEALKGGRIQAVIATPSL